MRKIAPSILSADLANLASEVQEVAEAGADWIHVDVMDGHFVPNITVGIPVVKSLRNITSLPLDVHLMIENPEAYVSDFARAGADLLTVHVEACPHLHRVVSQIKELGVRAGVALNPATPLSSLEEIVEEVDMVLVMSVNPGFGGQEFIPQSLDKIRRLKRWLEQRGLERIEIEVDGGIKVDNAAQVARAGADILVSGSGIFGLKDRKEALRLMREAIEGV
ncbi:MAG: ribulose-phosphate 3-epimerase [Deltaproteobacteria bacterium]|nr:MAG: ribulose-phosphate 3-epimerase [Deltaproteobacteria bacterium]HEX15590.1 ribulose-phosphate 3-epimerase [Deltaproteobacteria bacterium]